MFIYIPSNRTTTIRATQEKSVACEVCHANFTYQQTRLSVGQDGSLFSWSAESAYEKAAKDAESKLEKMFATEHDAVPCPECGWVQQAMVDSVNSRSYEGLKTLSIMAMLMGFGLGAVLVVGGFLMREVHAVIVGTGFGVVSIGAMTGWALLQCRHALLSWGNPNRHFTRDAADAPSSRNTNLD